MTDLIWSFAPWLAFLLGTRVTSLYGAVAIGIAAAVIVTGRAVARHQLHLLDVAGLCYFLALGAVLVAVHPGHLEFWSRYAQAGSHRALTLIIVPFGALYLAYRYSQQQAKQAQDGTPPAGPAASGSALPTPASSSH